MTLAKRVVSLVLPATAFVASPVRRGKDPSPTASKFGGAPYAEAGDSWPMCGCGRGLSFIFQYNLAQCLHLKSLGLYQFFYCHECGSWGDIPPELKDAWAVRSYGAPSDTKAKVLVDTSPAGVKTKPCLAQPELVQSLPDWEGLDFVAPDVAVLSAKGNDEEPWAEYQSVAEELVGEDPAYRTQVGGYPIWVQGAEFPSCRECSQTMRLLAQIDSVERASLMWGDSGCVYLFACPAHPTQFDMRLQCF